MHDAEIVRGLRAGEPAALAGLVERYADRLYRSAWVLCANEADAKDVAFRKR